MIKVGINGYPEALWLSSSAICCRMVVVAPDSLAAL